ncbi:DUF4234 domain-containing protein [Candidatus Poribacteria bacterium]|nr:DUF4234 domain-containing protein [Candidatus Poribacteria bacterium]
MQNHPYPRADGVRNIVFGIIFSLLTCGLYSLYWQYKQMETLNGWLGRTDYRFWLWFFLSILTCGIFALYYEYKMAVGINEIQENSGLQVNHSLAVTCVLLAILGIGIASLAIQQWEINKFYNAREDV